MNNKSILSKIDGYFEHQKDVWGNLIYFDEIQIEDTKINHKLPTDTNVRSSSDEDKNEWNNANNLEELNSLICNCTNCELGLTRKNLVFGTGNPNADIMFIGEGPGADEDEQGKPFVGRAGQLLTKIINSIEFSRDEVFIANIVKCRPPNNRKPLPTEVDTCIPYLNKQIELIKPKFIVALGLTAIDALLGKSHKMGEERGKLLDYRGAKLLVTYHPAALLRNPSWKAAVWEDVQLLKKLYLESKNSENG